MYNVDDIFLSLIFVVNFTTFFYSFTLHIVGLIHPTFALHAC